MVTNHRTESTALPQEHTGWDWVPSPQAWAKDPDWQSFVDYWASSDHPDISDLRSGILKLGPEGIEYPVEKMTGNEMLIRACYDDIYRRVRTCRERNKRGGILLTGQPGVGKSFWLLYALVRLIQGNFEPVIFARGSFIWVFYNGSAYLRICNNTRDLPKRNGHHMIALIDTDSSNSPPDSLLVDTMSPLFPVQAASPNPRQHRGWRKQRGAIMIGMPLWSVDELYTGFPTQIRFSSFTDDLRTFLASGSTEGASPLLDSLQEQTLNSTTSLEEKTPTWAARALLDMSIQEFGSSIYGSSARDVYRGTFFSSEEEANRSSACRNIEADTIRRAYPSMHVDPHGMSYTLISLIPMRSSHPERSDKFELAFKSEYIGAKVKEMKDLFSFKQARELAAFCRFTPDGSSFSGHLFEILAHYTLAGRSDRAVTIGKLYRMDAGDSNTFLWTPDMDADYDPFVVSQRTITRVDFGSKKSSECDRFDDVGEKYFVPTAFSNPLVDSFFVDYDAERRLTRIWLFRMTLALTEAHGGSEKGYSRVHSIITAVQEQERSHTLNVHYVLVVPDEARERRSWVMPAGWETAHPGVAFVSVQCLVINTLKGNSSGER